jgi:hypothetical protein
VGNLFATRLPATLTVMTPILVLDVLLALPIAMWVAYRRGSLTDRAIMVVTVTSTLDMFAAFMGWDPIGRFAGIAGSMAGVLAVGVLAAMLAPPTWGVPAQFLALFAGTLAMGAVSVSMVWGHWYLTEGALPSWPLRDPAAVRSETDRLLNLADALGAGALVFRTPMAVSPGSVALGRMAPVFERARKALDVVAWDPAGLWERDAAAEHAEKFGVLAACDPLHDEVDEPVVYARMRGLGFDNKYHSGRLEELAEALAGCEEAFVVFESGGAWREALKFAGIAAGAGASAFLDGEEGEDGDDDEDETPIGDPDDDDDGDWDDDEDEDDEDPLEAVTA